MNKIICDVCGTDYPETAAQCPICGCASAGAQTSAANDVTDEEQGSGYTYVKGGRFSRSNVRKRLKESQYQQVPVPLPEEEPDYPEYEDDEEDDEDEEEEQTGSNRGLIIVIVILLLAIVAVGTYIAVSVFGLGFSSGKKPDQETKPSTSQQAEEPSGETTDPAAQDVVCTGLTLSDLEINLKSAGGVWQLTATPEPADTTQKVVFTSSDETVVTVDSTGLVTAVGSGEATVTVTCGDVTVQCPVVCQTEEDPTEETDPVETTEPTEETEPTEADGDFKLKLNREDFTLKKKGATHKLYAGDVDAADITWTSDNEEVVTIEKGVVTAVGNGRTRVYGEYNGQKVSCWVSCKLPKEDTEPEQTTAPEETTEPEQTTEPEATTEPEETVADNGDYALKVNGHVSPYGDEENASVTITVGESFRLSVEGTQGGAQDVTWSESKDGICSVNGRSITGESKGKVILTATIGDQTFTCTVIVKD